jgi:hypothetical protein
MATHIHEVLRDPPDDPIRLVELISRPSGRSVEFRQFASVFVQLHVPTIGYVPTYDSWAVESLRHHLGRTRAELDVSYVPFARAARYLSLIGLCS